MQKFAGPLILIGLGCAWLLKALNVSNSVDWVWVILLGVIGVVLLIWRPTARWRLGTGLWLLGACLTSLLRMLGQIEVKHEVPILVILAGLFWGAMSLLPANAKEKAAGEKTADQQANPDENR
jgi:uncharacterized membrane protein